MHLTLCKQHFVFCKSIKISPLLFLCPLYNWIIRVSISAGLIRRSVWEQFLSKTAVIRCLWSGLLLCKQWELQNKISSEYGLCKLYYFSIILPHLNVAVKMLNVTLLRHLVIYFKQHVGAVWAKAATCGPSMLVGYCWATIWLLWAGWLQSHN